MSKQKMHSITDLVESGRIGVSDRTVRRLIQRGEIKAVDVGAGSVAQYRISEKELGRFLSRERHAKKSAPRRKA